MKKLLLLSLIVAAAACKKKTTPPPTTTNPNPTPQTVYHDLPYWKDDTLKGVAINYGYFDAIYPFSKGVQSWIKHKGVEYRLRAYEMANSGFSDSTGYYFCDLFDVNGKQINSDSVINVTVSTSRSWNKNYKVWDTTLQSVMMNFPPFDKNISFYLALHKK